MPLLLKGLKEIHEQLFTGKDGKPVISFVRFCRDHVKDMKDHGVIFVQVLGSLPNHDRRSISCGWDTEILNYFRVLGQKKEAKRKGRPWNKKI